jgi:hypothetical protein
MKKLITITFSLLLAEYGITQGCVAIRNVNSVIPNIFIRDLQPDNKWILNMTNRYFEASSTFVGDKFITDSLVTNRLNTLNFSLFKLLNKGWSLNLQIPVSANSRKNSGDHGGPRTPKYTTKAFGLGDIRFTAYKWLFNESANTKTNIQVGLGIKLPTGDYRYQDYFTRNDSTKILAPIDQAIQLGDGGTGITAEINSFYTITSSIKVFVNGFYLINPREQNGVSNLKGRNASQIEIANNTQVMSVPDQFNIRGGINVDFRKITLNTSIRYEKVPLQDLIGGNKGFRRAASITSIEPGLTYKAKNSFIFAFVGVPVKRNIVQSIENNMTPAGFADYIFTFGTQFNL